MTKKLYTKSKLIGGHKYEMKMINEPSARSQKALEEANFQNVPQWDGQEVP